MMKRMLVTIFIFGALAVILGAFGAHALESKISADSLAAYKTGVLYHFVHTLAALMVVMLWHHYKIRLYKLVVLFFLVGILLFSGSLYLLTTREVTGLAIGWIGPITPLGGLFLIAGWITSAVGAYLTGNKKMHID